MPHRTNQRRARPNRKIEMPAMRIADVRQRNQRTETAILVFISDEPFAQFRSDRAGVPINNPCRRLGESGGTAACWRRCNGPYHDANARASGNVPGQPDMRYMASALRRFVWLQLTC